MISGGTLGAPLSEKNVPLPLSLLKWWSREAKWTQIGLIPLLKDKSSLMDSSFTFMNKM